MKNESRLLGAILQDNAILWQTSATAADFEQPRNRAVFELVAREVGEGSPISIVEASELLPQIPPAYIAELTTDVVTSAWRRYEKAMFAEKRRRQIRLIGERLTAAEGDIDELTAWAREQLAEAERDEGSLLPVADMVPRLIDDIERRYNLHGQIPGISTGLMALDEQINGLEAGRLYYVGARPSQGKSALLHNFILAAMTEGKRAGLITLESGALEVMRRFFANLTGIDSTKINKGLLKPESFSAMVDVGAQMSDKWRLWFAEGHQGTLAEVQARARQMVRSHGVEVLYIDYLQMIAQTDSRQTMREHMVRCSKAMKGLSLELSVPVVAAAQLSRDAENRRPKLSDFGESSQLEMDADVAMLLYHESKEGAEESILIVDKNRDGATGDIPIYFDKPRMRFTPRATGDY
ncbi:MAG: replicative DNA helicase [Cyclobacteriaceae bacterium]|nr:replicative DNA helicase [Cyclobacteriaceae bacterium]